MPAGAPSAWPSSSAFAWQPPEAGERQFVVVLCYGRDLPATAILRHRRLQADSTPGLHPMTIAPARAARPLTSLLPLLVLLGLTAMAMRIPILAVPPVLPFIRDDLHMSEAE